MIGTTISHYRILDKLGEGGMGVVYVAEDTLLGRRVAIKALTTDLRKQSFRSRLLREARAVSSLNHPNIATVHDFGETPEGQPYIVMELVDGQGLGDLIGGGALTVERAVEIIGHVAAALGEAHRLGIVHRDVKPSNVVVGERGEVKVLDFGLAKRIQEEAAGDDKAAAALLATQTSEGLVVGTPMYLSPEQALGHPVDARSDLFSLGALLYECVTGRPAFPGKTAAAVCAKVIRDDPPPPSSVNPGVPPELDRVTLKALAKTPERRYQSAAELLADLRALLPSLRDLGDAPLPKREATAAPRERRTSAFYALSRTLSRPRVLAAVFLATFAAALLAVWVGTSWLRPAYYVPNPEARRWHDRGTEALRNGSYHTASLMLQEAVKADEKFALARARLAEALSELDYTDRAKDEIIRAGQLDKDGLALAPLDALYLQAVTDTVMREHPKAVAAYVRIAGEVPQEARASAMLDVGRAYEKSENLGEAVRSFQDASGRDPLYAPAFLRLGVAYGRRQDAENALKAFDEAERLYTAQGNLEGLTEVLYQRGSFLNKRRILGEARAALDRALEKARATENVSQQVLTLLQLSSVIFGQGDTALARKVAADAVGLAQANGMENLTTRGLIDVGNTLFSAGRYEDAEGFYKQALEFARRNRGRRNEARALLSLGSLYSHLGRMEDSRLFVEQSLPFYRQGGYHKEVSQGLNILGHVHDQKGEYDAALKLFEEQLQLARQTGDESLVAGAHLGAGLVLLHQERFADVLPHSESGLGLYRKLGVPQYVGHMFVHRANALLQLGRVDEAREALAEAEELRGRAGGFGELNALTTLLAARIALVESRTEAAKEAGRKALALAGKDYWAVIVEANNVLCLAESRGGSPRAGASKCEAAVSASLKFGDPRLIASALLAQAEVFLKGGEAQKSETAAARALEINVRLGQFESAWRAARLAARAARLRGDEVGAVGYDQRADGFFYQFRMTLSDEAFNNYLARPDVRSFMGEKRGAARAKG